MPKRGYPIPLNSVAADQEPPRSTSTRFVLPLEMAASTELKTTFASHYTKVVSLAEALDPASIAVYTKRATGEKFLINPNKEK